MFLPPSNIIKRTYLFRYDKNVGTCFALDVDGKQYFITAKHIVPHIASGENVQFYYMGDWISEPVTIVNCTNPQADITAFVVAKQMVPKEFVLAFTSKETPPDFFLGQEVFLLGFPNSFFELKIPTAPNINNGYPLPFFRKTIISHFGNKHEMQSLVSQRLIE